MRDNCFCGGHIRKLYSVSEQLVELVHVYVTILLLVLESAHLWPRSICGRCVAIVVVVPCLILLFLALVI